MIAAARPARGPATPAVQRRARSLRALVVARAQRVPVQPPSDPNATLQTVVRALETAAVVAAVGAHLAAAATAVQQRQAAAPAQSRRQQQPVSEQQGSRRTAHAVAAPAAPVGFMAQPAGWASPSSLWLTLPLLAAVVLGRIRAWISGNRCVAQHTAGASPAVDVCWCGALSVAMGLCAWWATTTAWGVGTAAGLHCLLSILYQQPPCILIPRCIVQHPAPRHHGSCGAPAAC